MEYGKKITKTSYHKGKQTTVQTWYSIPIIVNDKSSTLTEILSSLDLISTKKTKEVILRIEADGSYKFKKITKEYEVEV